MANLFPERCLAYGLLNVPYAIPDPTFDADTFVERVKNNFGYDAFGYWYFFTADAAHKVIEDNVIPLPLVICIAFLTLSSLDRILYMPCLREGSRSHETSVRWQRDAEEELTEWVRGAPWGIYGCRREKVLH